MGIRDELLETVQQYIKKNNGKEPTKIFLTRDDERRLAAMRTDEAGGSVSAGVRKKWKTVDGKEVVWEAESRHCE